MLRKVMVKIELERIDIQERVIMKKLLNSSTKDLIMSSEFTKKQIFKIKKLIYIKFICKIRKI